MPSANKDRIRVTLHVDRKIYALVKMWSEVDQTPISRLFDEVFRPHVERFEKFGSFLEYKHFGLEEEGEGHISDEEMEEMERKEKKSQKERELISKMTKKEQEKHYQKFIEFMKQEDERQQKEDDEYDERWIKAHSKMQKNMS